MNPSASPGRQAARLVFPGFAVGSDDPREALALAGLGVGGFCLYGGRPEEVAALTSRLRERASHPLLFCADYEDGVATQCPGATALPSNMGVGASGSESLAFAKGALTGREARALGVRWVLAPVCDLATRPENPIVNVRAFSSDPGAVTRLARAFLKGLRSEGALGCLKHFPGHGDTRKDSHLELPRVAASRALLGRRELVPFASLAAEAETLMTGHLAVPALEKGARVPYSLSAGQRRTLREALGFGGLVCTDALNMRAVAGRFEPLDAALRALKGGADVLLVPEKPRELVASLSAAVEGDASLAAAAAAAEARLERVLALVPPEEPSAASLAAVGGPEHRRAAEVMAEGCLAWSGAPAGPLPARLRYWEPEADGPGAWLGKDFVAELSALGASPRPYEGRSGEGPLVVASFLGPRAYSGRIAFGPDKAARIRAALKREPGALVVAFGSPFVLAELKAGGLCAFSRNAPAQRAAARALLGKLAVAARFP